MQISLTEQDAVEVRVSSQGRDDMLRELAASGEPVGAYREMKIMADFVVSPDGSTHALGRSPVPVPGTCFRVLLPRGELRSRLAAAW